MRIVRCRHEGKKYYGKINGDEIILYKTAPMLGGKNRISFPAEKGRIPFSRDILCAPCLPGKAVCVGLNYRDHAMELGLALPKSPVLFLKPSTSLIGPGDTIIYPDMSQRVDYEAELVVVIGKKAHCVSENEAFEYVVGYTCGNDVTARDLQPKDGQWTVSKSFDTFMPLGPWIETDLDPSHLSIRAILNSEIRQSSHTGNLIFSVPELIAYISRIMTLEPGDVIMTGTPSGIGPMQKGDRIAIEIEGIGILENTVG